MCSPKLLLIKPIGKYNAASKKKKNGCFLRNDFLSFFLSFFVTVQFFAILRKELISLTIVSLIKRPHNCT